MKLKELLHVLANVDPEARIAIHLEDLSEDYTITGIEVSLPASEAVRMPRIPSDRYITPDGHPLVVLHVAEDSDTKES